MLRTMIPRVIFTFRATSQHMIPDYSPKPKEITHPGFQKYLKWLNQKSLQMEIPEVELRSYLASRPFKLKELTKAPILIALNWDQPFEIMCDAVILAIGAVSRAKG
ncbi:hypothetical protein Tco_0401525 [Tanacetum coccineum]